MINDRFSSVFIGIIIFTTLTLSDCSRKSRSIGADNVIAVIAEAGEYKQLEQSLKEVFEREMQAPFRETIFSLKNITLDRFDKYRRWKSLVIVSTLDSEGEVLPIIKSMLSQENLEKVKSGQSFAFNKKDAWAYDQQLLVLVSSDIAVLKDKLTQNKDHLFNIVDSFLNKRVEREMFAKSEQHRLEVDLFEKFSWKLRIQHDYRVIFEDSGKSFVMLQRRVPARDFMVYWHPTDDPSIITKEWIIQKRNELNQNFAEKDSVDERYTTYEEVEFSGRRAYKLTGLWYTSLHGAGGGPFRSYTFYDENDGKIYMLDYAVFAPDRGKEPILRQMEIMARTFQTGSDI